VDDTRQPYAYAYNNPLLWTDPSGLDVWGDIGAGMPAFGAGVLDDLTFGASSAILGAIIPDGDVLPSSDSSRALGGGEMSTQGIVARWIEMRSAASRMAESVKQPQLVTLELAENYRRLDPSEREEIDRYLGVQALSADETERFDALALINEFRIVSAIDKLMELTARSGGG
jgi:hypothetical protein